MEELRALMSGPSKSAQRKRGNLGISDKDDQTPVMAMPFPSFKRSRSSLSKYNEMMISIRKRSPTRVMRSLINRFSRVARNSLVNGPSVNDEMGEKMKSRYNLLRQGFKRGDFSRVARSSLVGGPKTDDEMEQELRSEINLLRQNFKRSGFSRISRSSLLNGLNAHGETEDKLRSEIDYLRRASFKRNGYSRISRSSLLSGQNVDDGKEEKLQSDIDFLHRGFEQGDEPSSTVQSNENESPHNSPRNDMLPKQRRTEGDAKMVRMMRAAGGPGDMVRMMRAQAPAGGDMVRMMRTAEGPVKMVRMM